MPLLFHLSVGITMRASACLETFVWNLRISGRVGSPTLNCYLIIFISRIAVGLGSNRREPFDGAVGYQKKSMATSNSVAQRRLPFAVAERQRGLSTPTSSAGHGSRKCVGRATQIVAWNTPLTLGIEAVIGSQVIQVNTPNGSEMRHRLDTTNPVLDRGG